jgi:sugar diacid utilization regulator/putative methionine-R-sulfoxide reductase with GAF domain
MQSPNSREKKLETLLDATQTLNSSQNTDQILNSLLKLSLDLIDGGDTGCIFLYNNTLKLLEMYAYVGMGDSVKDVKMVPDESMTGLAFTRKEAVLFPDRESVKNHMSSLSSKNFKLILSGNIDPSNIYGSICCPLIYQDKALGVLVIDNFKNTAPLTENDVELLKAISVQATIAIINAKNFEKELQNNQKLEEYNKIIENQKDMYKYSTQIHGKFTNMVLKGSSFDDILREVKTLSGKDVFLVDLFYSISNHTFGKTLPKKFCCLKPLMMKKLKKHKNSTFFDSSLNIYLFSFPIMVKQEAMGWLCLINKTTPLTENEVIIAERSATILAIEMLKQNELIDLEQSLKGDFLDGLLAGINDDYLQKYLANYQFNLLSPHRILLIKFVFSSSINHNNKIREKHIRDCLKRYYRLFNAELRTHFPGSIALIRQHYMVCILESDKFNEDRQIQNILDMIKKKFNQSYSQDYKDLQVKIGISETFKNIKNFKRAYNNTMQTIKMIADTNESIKILFFKDIDVKRLLLANNEEDLLLFYNNLLSPLLRYKKNSQKDFLKTLEIYLRSNCNWSESKDILHIHGNTLTYRLDRISGILGIDLKNYRDKLRLQVAFEIQELLK